MRIHILLIGTSCMALPFSFNSLPWHKVINHELKCKCDVRMYLLMYAWVFLLICMYLNINMKNR